MVLDLSLSSVYHWNENTVHCVTANKEAPPWLQWSGARMDAEWWLACYWQQLEKVPFPHYHMPVTPSALHKENHSQGIINVAFLAFVKGVLWVDLFTYSKICNEDYPAVQWWYSFNPNPLKCLYNMYIYHNLWITNSLIQLVNTYGTFIL